jgi:pimeloyl-ACP methyl ester carboxylesterase
MAESSSRRFLVILFIYLLAALLNTLVFSLSTETRAPSPQIIHGQRCLLLPCATNDKKMNPPLVLMGGMGQTIASYESHLPFLSRERTVLVYEPMGVGRLASSTSDWTNVTLPRQAEQLHGVLSALFFDNPLQDESPAPQVVDLVGFSLGGRIQMAYACLYPDRIRRLACTGVAASRSPMAQAAIMAWKDLLSSSDSDFPCRGFAWNLLQTTYSPTFLLRQSPKRLKTWINFICRSHSRQGLLALLKQTYFDHDNDDKDVNAWTTVNMAQRLAVSSTNEFSTLFLVGAEDLMAPPEHVQTLLDMLNTNDSKNRRATCMIIPGCGHAVPTEEPRLWRTHVLGFLSSST